MLALRAASSVCSYAALRSRPNVKLSSMVQLHDLRRTRRAVQAEGQAGGEPKGFLACSNAHLERDQSVVSLTRIEPDVTEARLDAASLSTEQGTSHYLLRGAVGARYDRHRSFASSRRRRQERESDVLVR